MNHVDGLAAAVPTANREIYRKHAENAAAMFKLVGMHFDRMIALRDPATVPLRQTPAPSRH